MWDQHVAEGSFRKSSDLALLGLRKMSGRPPSLELSTHYRVPMVSITGAIQLQSIRKTNRDANKIRICSHRMHLQIADGWLSRALVPA